MSQTPTSPRAQWFVLFASLAGAVVLYGFVAYSLAASRTSVAENPLPVPLAYAIAGAALLAAVIWVRVRLSVPRSDTLSGGPPSASYALLTAARFKVESLVAMALAEVAAVVGFARVALGAPWTEYLPFGLASFLVLVAVVLPAGLSYWSEWERIEAGPSSGLRG
jgi:hypothetical protein